MQSREQSNGRIAFVVQRYGVEVNGGAESLCRWVAERLQKYFAVEVLTTCALDYLSWDNYYPAGATTVNAMPVRRFPTDAPRDMSKFNAFARRLFARPQRALLEELEWIRLQGPYSSELLEYIKDHAEEFDLFLFVTYSYLTTFVGLQLVPDKSLLLPTAHDEPQFHFSAFQPLFHLPQGIIYCTAEERRLVQQTWHNHQVPSCVAGVGIAPQNGRPAADKSDAPSLKTAEVFEKFRLDPSVPYLLYIGRIDVMKGCRELIQHFLTYLDERSAELHLVLVGKQTMDLPAHPQIHPLGFVSDAEKDAILRQAAVCVNPSEYESLSLVILEAWQAGIPVLVNGASDVLVEHCIASNGGLYYTNYDEFALCLDVLLSDQAARSAMGDQGQQYVAEHYSWDTVEQTYVDFIVQMR
jgi:glycosyltransferase involved in cell wall biosynthesis